MVQHLEMNDTEVGILVSALAFALAALAYALRVGAGWQHLRSDITYLRRDVDQILRQYRLTPVQEQERKRRR